MLLPFLLVGAITRVARSGPWGASALVPVAGSALLVATLLTAARFTRRIVALNAPGVPSQLRQAAGGILTFAVLAWIVSARDASPVPAAVVLVFGMSAAAEEVAFRFLLPNLVYYELSNAGYRPAASAIVAAMTSQACFGLSHGWSSTWSMPEPMIAASLVGSGLALFALARNAGLGAAVAVHACLNWSVTNRFPEYGRFPEPQGVALWFALSVAAAGATAISGGFRSSTHTPGGSQ